MTLKFKKIKTTKKTKKKCEIKTIYLDSLMIKSYLMLKKLYLVNRVSHKSLLLTRISGLRNYTFLSSK